MKNTPMTDEIRTLRLERGNTAMPCLAISYALNPRRGNTRENPTSQLSGMTVAIDANGGGGTKFRLTLAETRVDQNGDSTTGNTYIFDGASGGTGTVTAVCPTLYELVRQLNLIDGVNAWALNAPHFLSLAADTFQDLSATAIPNRRHHLSVLYRTVGAGTAGYLRIGVPEELDAGYLGMVNIRGFCTGVTSGTLRVYRDGFSQNLSSGDEKPILQKTLAAAETAYLEKDKTDAWDVQGPVILEVNSTDLSAFDYTFSYIGRNV